MFKFVKVLVATSVIGLAGPVLAEDPLSIGFIIPNAPGEAGWDHELDRGRRTMEAHFGDQIQVQSVDSVGEGPDSTRIMNRLAAKGADVLFLGSFGHYARTRQ